MDDIRGLVEIDNKSKTVLYRRPLPSLKPGESQFGRTGIGNWLVWAAKAQEVMKPCQ